jgi:hypothetical protein
MYYAEFASQIFNPMRHALCSMPCEFCVLTPDTRHLKPGRPKPETCEKRHLAWCSKPNVNGSGISLGHPVAATGTRVLVTMLHEMKRRKARYGLECICGGGGLGIAAVFERKE